MHFLTNMIRFLIPKIGGKPTNGDSKWHPTSDRFLDCFFIDLASVLGATLEPCWQLFRSKWGYAVVSSPLFAWVDVLIRVFSRPDPPLAKNVACRSSILEGTGLDFGICWAPFWKFLVTIYPLFGIHFLHNLQIN